MRDPAPDPGADALAARVVETLRTGEGPTHLFGISLEDVGPAYARAAMCVTESMLNGVGTIHGGVLFTLADTAFAWACNSRNAASVAQQASIVFLLPARPGDRLVAEAREVGLEGRTGVYGVEVRLEDGRLAASFTGLSRTLGRSIVEDDPAAPPYPTITGDRS